ncbi:MAG TPA: CBS domain-containing protein [Acidimicrobiales bacterium]|nr:CBS domain-containing protein [Acidimicrobiales bacterium]
MTVRTPPAGEIGHRVVPLPGGRVLRVRPVEPGDVDGLVALYAGLSDGDRYRRFFSAYSPPRTFFARLASVVDRGGFGVVAVVDGTEEIVGEASYEMLPDGDGELGMTVAAGQRGWLGPYLLDVLAEAAAARGVPNLEADVLVTNSRMLTLLRARGYATLPSSDWVSLRLMVGTAGRTPVWPPRARDGTDDRPRVLVEAPGGRWQGTTDAEDAGLQVITCSGPKGRRTRCPALAGEPCPLAATADAVVVANAPDDDRWARLVAAHHDTHPGVPVCIEPRGGSRDDQRVAVRLVDRLAREHRRMSSHNPTSHPQGGDAMHAIDAARKAPATIGCDHTITEAADTMDRLAVGALVVVEGDGRPVGIVTDRDLTVRGLARRAGPDARVDSVMSTDLISLAPDADLRDALTIFESHAIRRLPLVADDRLVGMVTMDDLLVDTVSDLGRMIRPITGQVLFGHREPVPPATTG